MLSIYLCEEVMEVQYIHQRGGCAGLDFLDTK